MFALIINIFYIQVFHLVHFIVLSICYCFAFQVSQVYQTMKIESLSRMIPFFDFSVVEKISVDAVKHNFVALKVDHMKGVVIFGNMVSLILVTLNFVLMIASPKQLFPNFFFLIIRENNE